MAPRRKKTVKSPNIGCLIMFLGFLAVLILFIIKFPDIKQTLDKTKFFDLVAEKTSSTSNSAGEQPSAQDSGDKGLKTNPSPGATKPDVPLPAAEEPAGVAVSRQASLFFVKIEADGLIASKEVKRGVPLGDSPLTDALSALLAGPSEGEIRAGLVSLIPRGAVIRGISIRGSTAIIDMNEAFMYNHYGVEGYAAQLKQIVYTATSFPSVQDVQFLIEGKTVDYLGGEGVYIGKPLSRNSF